MSEALQHDPRTKQQIKDALYEFLYAPIQKQLKHCLDTLIIKNTVLCKYTHRSFVYKGMFYSCDSAPTPRIMNRLHIQLQPAMNNYLKELQELNEKELPYVVGFINQVLNSSNDLHDYLRLLPDSVHHPITSLVSTCPCRAVKLPESLVVDLKSKNQTPINMMKQRMVANLLV